VVANKNLTREDGQTGVDLIPALVGTNKPGHTDLLKQRAGALKAGAGAGAGVVVQLCVLTGFT
jgi:hypothetical protein